MATGYPPPLALPEGFFLRLLLLLFFVPTGGVSADAVVTGAVFCDQCRDGQRSLFDYPLFGAKVAVECAGGSDGQVALYTEGTTSWFGIYGLRIDGGHDMSHCSAKVVGGPEGCGAGAGPAKGLNLLLRIFGMELYGVDALLSLPPQPMDFCPNSSSPHLPPPPAHPSAPPPPTLPLPPLSPPPPSRPPSRPFPQASACPYEKWTLREYRCYWRVVAPDTTVATAFGLVAARRYGVEMTLMEGLQGRGDLYRTLLREATAALLNSFNGPVFFYPTLGVIYRMNSALLGSPREALMAALRFRRANSGSAHYGGARCNFTPCN